MRSTKSEGEYQLDLLPANRGLLSNLVLYGNKNDVMLVDCNVLLAMCTLNVSRRNLAITLSRHQSPWSETTRLDESASIAFPVKFLVSADNPSCTLQI